MRLVRALMQGLAGFALGAALGYWGLLWLRSQERQVRQRMDAPPAAGGADRPAAEPPPGGGLLDLVADRFRLAMEEGRKAAAAARAELEAEIKADLKHAPPPAPVM